MISENVGYDEKGGLKHEGKSVDEESENPGDVRMKGPGGSVLTLAESGGVQLNDRISLEGLFGEYGECYDQKRGGKTADNDCIDCGGS